MKHSWMLLFIALLQIQCSNANNSLSLDDAIQLKGKDSKRADGFASAMAISGDTAVIGAPVGDIYAANNDREGTVHIFMKTGTGWKNTGLLRTSIFSDTRVKFLGCEVDIHKNTIIASAQEKIYVFQRDGKEWDHTGTIPRKYKYSTRSDKFPSSMGQRSIAISGDTIASGEDLDSPSSHVSVYRKAGEEWVESAVIAPDSERST